MLLQERPDTTEQDLALAAMGLRLERCEDEPQFEVWPCTMPAIALFADCLTQWNVGFGGPVGLRYEAVKTVLEIRDEPRHTWSQLFDDLKVCESAALRHFEGLRPPEMTPVAKPPAPTN